MHRINGAATENAELWAAPLPTGTTGDVTVTWDSAVTHRHLTLLSTSLDSLATAYVGSATPDGNGGYGISGLTVPSGGVLVGGTLGDAFVTDQTTQFGPNVVFDWSVQDQATRANGQKLFTHVFSGRTAAPEDWPVLISAEQKTNPRLVETIGNIDLVPAERRVGGKGQGARGKGQGARGKLSHGSFHACKRGSTKSLFHRPFGRSLHRERF